MIYGATGFTGTLIAEEAVRRGHKPILAGRDASKLKPLAERLGLEWQAISLSDTAALGKAVAEVDLVMHSAGPFTFTSKPMLRACLSGRSHYLDITGEVQVFEDVFSFDAMAKQAGVALIPGVGFDVIPTNCLAQYVADQVKDAVELEIAIAARSFGSPSVGTAQSMMELVAQGGLERRDGRLASLPLGEGVRSVRFPHGVRDAMPIPWGDLSTSYRSTGIPNITCYMRQRKQAARTIRWFGGIAQGLISVKLIRRAIQAVQKRVVKPPTETQRDAGSAYIWACAADLYGHSKEAWLQTIEAYDFTALSTVLSVERVLASELAGAFAPAQAFGADFVLQIPGSKRFDSLDEA